MNVFTAPVSADTYQPLKSYFKVIFLQDQPPLDCELNEFQDMWWANIRKALIAFFGNGARVEDDDSNIGWEIQPMGYGWQIGVTKGRAVLVGCVMDLFTDTIVGELSEAGETTRSDYIYVDLMFSEVTAADDAEIMHPDLADSHGETTRRVQVEITLKIAEGSMPTAPADHYYIQVGYVVREPGETGLTMNNCITTMPAVTPQDSAQWTVLPSGMEMITDEYTGLSMGNEAYARDAMAVSVPLFRFAVNGTHSAGVESSEFRLTPKVGGVLTRHLAVKGIQDTYYDSEGNLDLCKVPVEVATGLYCLVEGRQIAGNGVASAWVNEGLYVTIETPVGLKPATPDAPTVTDVGEGAVSISWDAISKVENGPAISGVYLLLNFSDSDAINDPVLGSSGIEWCLPPGATEAVVKVPSYASTSKDTYYKVRVVAKLETGEIGSYGGVTAGNVSLRYILTLDDRGKLTALDAEAAKTLLPLEAIKIGTTSAKAVISEVTVYNFYIDSIGNVGIGVGVFDDIFDSVKFDYKIKILKLKFTLVTPNPWTAGADKVYLRAGSLAANRVQIDLADADGEADVNVSEVIIAENSGIDVDLYVENTITPVRIVLQGQFSFVRD